MFKIILFLCIGHGTKSISYLLLYPFPFLFWNTIKTHRSCRRIDYQCSPQTARKEEDPKVGEKTCGRHISILNVTLWYEFRGYVVFT